jgi:MSHA biogenesis protein MshQ
LTKTDDTTCNSATSASAISAALPWFGNSNNLPLHSEDPSARTTFGIFKTPIIYMRENF